MRKLLLLSAFLLLLFPQSVLANGAGLPAFFQINGKLSISNPLQAYGITASSFLIPQDFAPENYLVNQPISFVVDETQLETVIPAEALRGVKYTWEFGDGAKAIGTKNTHTYSKIGSYILLLTINLYSSDSGAPTQFIDSFLLNILPTADYNQLPKAVMAINGTTVDPLKNALNVNYNYPISFDARGSKVPNGAIEYFWNFGDGQSSHETTVSHKYGQSDFEVVVLRVKDNNGFISDTFAAIQNDPNARSSIPISPTSPTTTKHTPQGANIVLLLLIAGGLVACGSIFWFIKIRK